jgi:proteasome lid subunit RPN8/RPN11
VQVEPQWADGKLDAVSITVAGRSDTYGRAIFRDRAMEIIHTKPALKGALANEETEIRWWVEVRQAQSGVGGRRRASVRHRAYPLLYLDSVDVGSQKANGPDDSSLLVVSESLLRELLEESAESLDRERADFLVGHLVQERDGRIVVSLRSRIPASTEVDGSLVHFAFSARTFQAAQQALAERASDEVILGWHHNHPPPCGRECLMTVPACGTENVMFSVDDRVVHRSAFDRPYMVALVSGKGAGRRADDPLVRAYGWQRGLIREMEWSTF